eukprot:scaffold90806_cov59-Phaeocystis_antarctica.AAC.1
MESRGALGPSRLPAPRQLDTDPLLSSAGYRPAVNTALPRPRRGAEVSSAPSVGMSLVVTKLAQAASASMLLPVQCAGWSNAACSLSMRSTSAAGRIIATPRDILSCSSECRPSTTRLRRTSTSAAALCVMICVRAVSRTLAAVSSSTPRSSRSVSRYSPRASRPERKRSGASPRESRSAAYCCQFINRAGMFPIGWWAAARPRPTPNSSQNNRSDSSAVGGPLRRPGARASAESCSNAWLTSLNRCSAVSRASGFRSGWCRSACSRYAALTCSGAASRSMPRISCGDRNAERELVDLARASACIGGGARANACRSGGVRRARRDATNIAEGGCPIEGGCPKFEENGPTSLRHEQTIIHTKTST